jgi:hypothetical protein
MNTISLVSCVNFVCLKIHVKSHCVVQILNLCAMYCSFGKKYSVNQIFAEYKSIFWLDYHSYFITNKWPVGFLVRAADSGFGPR